MSDDDLSTRVQALEEMLAHKESEVNDLSDMVSQQWKRLEALERDLNRTNERIVTLEDEVGGDATEANQKPPHW